MTSDRSEAFVEIDAVLVHETEKAMLIDYEGNKVWIPKSQAWYDKEDEVFKMPEWLAMEKELI